MPSASNWPLLKCRSLAPFDCLLTFIACKDGQGDSQLKKRRNRHSPEQIVRKLRDADVMLTSGKSLAEVLQTMEISEATYHRWRNQCGGMEQG